MAAITESLSRFRLRCDIFCGKFLNLSKWRKYIGSVRFYKHLILTVLFLLVTVPWIFVGCLFFDNRNAEQEIVKLEGMLDSYMMAVSEETQEIEEEIINESILTETPYYQELYPDFYAPQALSLSEYCDDTIYLTFDDGPSPRTPEVLEILRDKNVKATFFVVGQNDEQSLQWMRDIVAEGHTLGMHSYSHKYKEIYSSVEAYLDDMYKMYSQIKETTGVTPTVFRFPGGSINAYNTSINQEIISEMLRRGFVPYDWNISSEDAAATPPSAQTIVSSVSAQAQRVNRGVVLMHDSDYKYTTVAALPELIDALTEQGYTFSEIKPETHPIVFQYQN